MSERPEKDEPATIEIAVAARLMSYVFTLGLLLGMLLMYSAIPWL